jgi:hypothetical protein
MSNQINLTTNSSSSSSIPSSSPSSSPSHSSSSSSSSSSSASSTESLSTFTKFYINLERIKKYYQQIAKLYIDNYYLLDKKIIEQDKLKKILNGGTNIPSSISLNLSEKIIFKNYEDNPNIFDEYKNKLKQIEEETKKQINKVLTDQKETEIKYVRQLLNRESFLANAINKFRKIIENDISHIKSNDIRMNISPPNNDGSDTTNLSDNYNIDEIINNFKYFITDSINSSKIKIQEEQRLKEEKRKQEEQKDIMESWKILSDSSSLTMNDIAKNKIQEAVTPIQRQLKSLTDTIGAVHENNSLKRKLNYEFDKSFPIFQSLSEVETQLNLNLNVTGGDKTKNKKTKVNQKVTHSSQVQLPKSSQQ